ncbi:hypothetical protein [Streptomyces sp. NPDC001083]|uniref:hypothetical protein n=1 Tax=Streptomyces sp. NPDC001083 TaxID=3364545 RepID=UPI0036C1F581
MVRDHDRVLAQAVREAGQGNSRLVVLVGSSSTGKTRACWESVRPLEKVGWWLWHPYAPTRAEAALADLASVRPNTVVWLNEAHHYLGDPRLGEQIGAALHGLLTSGRGPVLVLATLWPEYARQFMALPRPGEQDPHSRVRELLAGRTLAVPEAFDDEALHAAALLAEQGDALLADALVRAASTGRIAQDLAGAPELLRRYRHASPAAVALLHAAMDARRLGAGPSLSQAYLADAAVDYLDDIDYAQLNQDWVELAFAELTQPVHGKQAPLRRISPRPHHLVTSSPADGRAPLPTPLFQLADYLEQHGRTTRHRLCPPASFWNSALQHLSHPDDLYNLARAARARHRLQWADQLHQRAGDNGHVQALLAQAAQCLQDADLDGAMASYRRAADAGHTRALALLAEVHEQAAEPDMAETLAWQAAEAGHPRALARIAVLRERTANRAGAQTLALRAADAGHGQPLLKLALLRESRGLHQDAAATAALAAERGHPQVRAVLAGVREANGDLDSAATLYRQAADTGHTYALVCLAVLREEAHDSAGADALALEAAQAGHTRAVALLAGLRAEAGDRAGAEALCRTAAGTGHVPAMLALARLREQAGDLDRAEVLYRQAADTGDVHALMSVARLRERADDTEGAHALFRQAADAGHFPALTALAVLLEKRGESTEAEATAWQAVEAGQHHALVHLIAVRRRAGHEAAANCLAREVIDAGHTLRAAAPRTPLHPQPPGPGLAAS